MLASHEDARAWEQSYKFLKDIAGVSPKYRMGDGASEISKAGIEVSDDLHSFINVFIAIEHLCFLKV